MSVRYLTPATTFLAAFALLPLAAGAGPTAADQREVITKPNPYIAPLLPYLQGTVSFPAAATIDPKLRSVACGDVEIDSWSLTGPAKYLPPTPQNRQGSWAYGAPPVKLSHAALVGDFASGTCTYKLHVSAAKQFTLSFTTAKCPAGDSSSILTTANSVAGLGPYLVPGGQALTLNIKVAAVGCAPPPR